MQACALFLPGRGCPANACTAPFPGRAKPGGRGAPSWSPQGEGRLSSSCRCTSSKHFLRGSQSGFPAAVRSACSTHYSLRQALRHHVVVVGPRGIPQIAAPGTRKAQAVLYLMQGPERLDLAPAGQSIRVQARRRSFDKQRLLKHPRSENRGRA